MDNQIENALKKLQKEVAKKESELTDILKDAPAIIKSLESGIGKIKAIVSNHTFDNKEEEILFFKKDKPKLFSKLIYYKKVYYIELNRFSLGHQAQTVLLQKEVEEIDLFCFKNSEFIRYYLSEKTLIDEYYFLRDKEEITVNSDSFFLNETPVFQLFQTSK